MWATTVDRLVDMAPDLDIRLETLYLTVDYLDHYLPCSRISRWRLQLLGTICMLVTTKYEEELHVPIVDDLCYLTANNCSREEVLEMEGKVLECLEFELTLPTMQRFLRPLIHMINPRTPMLEFLANYITEPSLLQYRMLRYCSSLIVAALIFLVNFIL